MPSDGDDIRTITLWSLPEDVLVETGVPEGSVQLLTRWGVIRLEDPGPIALESLRRMTFGPVSLDNVVAGADRTRSGLSPDELTYRLKHVAIRTLSQADGSGFLLSVVPVTQRATFTPWTVPVDSRLTLSQMTVFRAQDDGLVLESTLADHRVVVHRPSIAAMVAMLDVPSTVAALAATFDLPTGVVQDVVGCLVATDLVVVEARG